MRSLPWRTRLYIGAGLCQFKSDGPPDSAAGPCNERRTSVQVEHRAVAPAPGHEHPSEHALPDGGFDHVALLDAGALMVQFGSACPWWGAEFRLNTYSDSVGTAGVLTFEP